MSRSTEDVKIRVENGQIRLEDCKIVVSKSGSSSNKPKWIRFILVDQNLSGLDRVIVISSGRAIRHAIVTLTEDEPESALMKVLPHAQNIEPLLIVGVDKNLKPLDLRFDKCSKEMIPGTATMIVEP
jgi:hypothetical protein